MAAENQDFVIYEGEDKDLRIEGIYDTNNNRLIEKNSISDAFWVASFYEQSDGEGLISKAIGNGVLIVEDGLIAVTIDSADTLDLEPGFYTHELRIINGGREYVVSRGKMLLKYKVGRVQSSS